MPGTAQAESIPSSAASTWTVTLSACGALTSGHRAIFGDEKLQMNDPMLGILQICMRHILLGMFPFSESAPNTDEYYFFWRWPHGCLPHRKFHIWVTSNTLAIISSAALAVVKRILSKPVTFMAILK